MEGQQSSPTTGNNRHLYVTSGSVQLHFPCVSFSLFLTTGPPLPQQEGAKLAASVQALQPQHLCEGQTWVGSNGNDRKRLKNSSGLTGYIYTCAGEGQQ